MLQENIISIGSSVVDIFISSNQFELETSATGAKLCQVYGEKLEVDSFKILTGGGGSNTAVGFSRLGFQTGLVSETGKDTLAELVLSDLKKENVNLEYLVQEKKEQTGGSVILVGPDGGRAVMVNRGAASLLDPKDLPLKALETAGWIHLSSLAGRKDTLSELFSLRYSTKRMSWNPGKKELELLASGSLVISKLPIEVLLINREEWQALAVVQSLLLHSIPIIVVTAGEDGGKVFVSQDTKTFKALNTHALDTTGAGDGFGVGFISGLLWDMGIDKAIELGIKNSASVVAQFGAKPGLLKKSQLLSY